MTSRELADMFGISPETIDKYADIGLLPRPDGPKNRWARWSPQCIAILEDLRTLKEDLAPLRDLAERRQLTGSIRLPTTH